MSTQLTEEQIKLITLHGWNGASQHHENFAVNRLRKYSWHEEWWQAEGKANLASLASPSKEILEEHPYCHNYGEGRSDERCDSPCGDNGVTCEWVSNKDAAYDYIKTQAKKFYNALNPEDRSSLASPSEEKREDVKAKNVKLGINDGTTVDVSGMSYEDMASLYHSLANKDKQIQSLKNHIEKLEKTLSDYRFAEGKRILPNASLESTESKEKESDTHFPNGNLKGCI